MPDNNLIKLIKKTLISALRESVGTKMFQHVYVRRKDTGKELDTMSDGEYSCAFYVSGVLAMVGLIDHAHSVVQTTVARMKEAGWVEIEQAKPGAVVVWPELDGHEHMGFALDDGTFISNSWSKRTPQIHDAKLPDGREPVAYYWHKVLEQE